LLAAILWKVEFETSWPCRRWHCGIAVLPEREQLLRGEPLADVAL
jgi:hypothetical protein